MLDKLIKIIFILIISGCGGSDGGSNPAAPTMGFSSADFMPTAASPASGTVSLQKNSINGDTVYIDVKITDMNYVFGGSIYLNYDPGKVNWSGKYQPGTFLENISAPIYMVALGGGEGTLVIGVSLMAPSSTHSGSGVLITIPFQVIAAGTSAISFSGVSALFDDATPNHLAVSSWDGGTITGY